MKRFVLVLSYELANWIKPSINMGIMRRSETTMGGIKKKQENTAIIIPHSSPVHLAQIGNFRPR